MILQVKIVNGVRKLVPLTTDSGQGLPLGAITAFYGTVAPTGYLICDGSSFDATVYPALAALLGGNTLPDLRECTLKGIGENPNATDHVKTGGLSLGEFQDDRIQEHTHLVRTSGSGSPGNQVSVLNSTSQTGQSVNMNSGRSGATTEVKSVGVNYIIKAVIGPIESAEADQVVNVVNNSRSYSINETDTGKTWIDGKKIYRKCCVLTSNKTVSVSNDWQNFISKSTYGLEDIGAIIDGKIWRITTNSIVNGVTLSVGNATYIQAHSEGITWNFDVGSVVILEYTKA